MLLSNIWPRDGSLIAPVRRIRFEFARRFTGHKTAASHALIPIMMPSPAPIPGPGPLPVFKLRNVDNPTPKTAPIAPQPRISVLAELIPLPRARSDLNHDSALTARTFLLGRLALRMSIFATSRKNIKSKPTGARASTPVPGSLAARLEVTMTTPEARSAAITRATLIPRRSSAIGMLRSSPLPAPLVRPAMRHPPKARGIPPPSKSTIIRPTSTLALKNSTANECISVRVLLTEGADPGRCGPVARFSGGLPSRRAFLEPRPSCG